MKKIKNNILFIGVLLFSTYFSVALGVSVERTIQPGEQDGVEQKAISNVVAKSICCGDVHKHKPILIQEPDNYRDKAKRDRYVEYDDTTKLWYVMERLTPAKRDWWKRRIACEMYMYYGGNLDSATRNYFASDLRAIEKNKGFMSRVRNYKFVRTEKDSLDYMGAWMRFCRNITSYYDPDKYGSTWVAYISSKSPNTKFDVFTPYIEMAVTIKIGLTFYVPLGIYRSPIAIAYDKANGIERQHLSILFHSHIAHLMYYINPRVAYMILRPLDSMRKLIHSSGIPYANSIGSFHVNATDTKLPHLRYQRNSAEILTEKEKKCFGASKFVVVYPEANRFYQISKNHWIVKYPYIGLEVPGELDPEKKYAVIKGSLVIDRVSLARHIQH